MTENTEFRIENLDIETVEEGHEEVSAGHFSGIANDVEADVVGVLANESLDDEFSLIRAILSEAPSKDSFELLVDVLLTDFDDRCIAFEYVFDHLESWPDECRVWPTKRNELVINREKLEVMSLVRALDLSRIDVSDFGFLDDWENVVRLNLNECKNLTSLDCLVGLRDLKYLSISHCMNLRDFRGVSKLRFMEELDMRGCTGLNDLELLSGLRSLRCLNISFCTHLNNIDGLLGLFYLGRIVAVFCPKISKKDLIFWHNRLGEEFICDL